MHCAFTRFFLADIQVTEFIFNLSFIGIATIAYSDYFLSLNCNGGTCNSLCYIQVSSTSPSPHSQWALIVSSLLHCPACAADCTVHAGVIKFA